MTKKQRKHEVLGGKVLGKTDYHIKQKNRGEKRIQERNAEKITRTQGDTAPTLKSRIAKKKGGGFVFTGKEEQN